MGGRVVEIKVKITFFRRPMDPSAVEKVYEAVRSIWGEDVQVSASHFRAGEAEQEAPGKA
jgi:hypothetical protein